MRDLSRRKPLLLPPPDLSVPVPLNLFLLFLLIVVLEFSMRVGRHPQSALAILHAGILAAQIDALALVAVFLVAALGEGAGAGGELGGDGGVGGDPVCEGVFAFLNDAVGRS